MTFLEIFLVGLGLSMDAVAVSTTNGMAHPQLPLSKRIGGPLLFGIFQAGMPCLGYFAGGLFSEFITRYAGIVVLLILTLIGGNMVKESFSAKEEDGAPRLLTLRILIMQAIATSIDAFAVGVGFSAMQVNLVTAALLIGLTTFLCSLAAYFMGRRFGNLLGSKAELMGGIILICIGIKAVL